MFDNNLPLIGEYAYAGLMIQCYRRPPLYYFLDVNVTKTQRMILSYLVHARFEQQSLKNISKYAFKYGNKRGENSIRTHIAKINDFFVTLTTRKIVGCNPGTGYYIFSPTNREIETRKKDKFSHIVW